MTRLTAVRKENVSALALLGDVRDVMAGAGEVQHKLDRLTASIAARFQSEVCSIYLLQPGQVLELSTTSGLYPEAVHQTRLRMSEGLVGEIAATAKPLNLADAQYHPKFVYRPETGEKRFRSFVGVPIIASHQVIGVLVVQCVTSRIYSDDQLEVLKTVAMVVSELAVGQHLVEPHRLAQDRRSTSHSQAVSGRGLCPGLIKAPAILHRPEIEITKLVADHVDVEETRLLHGMDAMQKNLDQLIADSGVGGEGEHGEILETYRMFAHDRGWLSDMLKTVRSGLTAEASVKKVLEELKLRLESASNVHVRQRIEDLEDISTRLLHTLTGTSLTAAHGDLPDRFILVANSLGPSELLEYGHDRIAGLVLEKGTSVSHIAIIARMMDIPVVSSVKGAADIIQNHDMVIVDGDQGEIYIRPSEDLEQEVDQHLALRAEKSAAYAAMRDLPAVTKDGVAISLHLNIGLHVDASEVAAQDVDGVGLYRTELPYLAYDHFPDTQQQAKIYREIFKQSAGKPIIFRTFDLGGDKRVSYLQLPHEENPAMGWRSTRITLDRPVLMRRQFAALLKAAEAKPLSIMFPMIATAEEFDIARALLEAEIAAFKQRGDVLPSSIRVGVMLEIPSLLYELPLILPKIDFISIGSNDLMQFFYAVDRTNPHVTRRYDPLRVSTFTMLRQVIEQCEAHEVEVSFCGDMATHPLEAMALLACGLRRVSVPVAAIGPVKAMVRSLNLSEIEQYIDVLSQTHHKSLRAYLQSFARDHGVAV